MGIHGSFRMQECRDESEIYNYQRIQLLNNQFINVILEGKSNTSVHVVETKFQSSFGKRIIYNHAVD